MKITVKHYDTTITIEKDYDDLTLTDMCAVFEDLLKGMSYHFDGHLEIVEEYDEVENKCTCIFETEAHGIEVIKAPSGKEFAVGGTDHKDRFRFCPWCGGTIDEGNND